MNPAEIRALVDHYIDACNRKDIDGMPTYNSRETKRMLAVHGSELASFSRRASAFFLDTALAAGLFAMTTSLTEPLLTRLGMVHGEKDIAFALNMNWYSIVWTVLYFGLSSYWGNGKTPGKRALGIRIVSLTHDKMSFWNCLERALGYGYSMLELCFGFFQYFIYPNKRTLHDRIADTIVVREKGNKTSRDKVVKKAGRSERPESKRIRKSSTQTLKRPGKSVPTEGIGRT